MYSSCFRKKDFTPTVDNSHLSTIAFEVLIFFDFSNFSRFHLIGLFSAKKIRLFVIYVFELKGLGRSKVGYLRN